ncbi:sensor histidine kinase [Paractinoplanes rishiriensis]|uniref:histidine kinase n=1 Tax=Paractinoplanes rishiriensis TaxID=1050105 RepID=A0A919JYU9_9ACTN|nr:sensor histidine kinase [Actinoplanes rishiriensis]GIE93476.1 two-component sensor histidine kinase [Actinoplanes rishiriensis]
MTTATPSPLIRGLSRGQLLVIDGVLATVVAACGWYAAVDGPSPVGWHEPVWLPVVAGVLLGLPVAVRRIRPVAAVWLALALVVACVATGVIPHYAGLAPILAMCPVLYTVGADVRRRRSVPIVIGCVVATALAFLAGDGTPFEIGLVGWVLGAAWTAGRTVRERRAYAARAAEQATELAVGQERLRIARELHDIVAHSMSMIAVKAAIADHLADSQPQEMRAALRVIATTSRDTLGELRRALGVLRTEGTLVPAPGLADLDELVTAARTSGLSVDLVVRGGDRIPDGVALAVFRLVQEALTNVVKHARASECRVAIEIGDGSLRLDVADNGSPVTAEPRPAAVDDPGSPAPGRPGGQGLIGMRERAAMFGGDLVAGPSAKGGWAVTTTLSWAA